MAVGLGAFLALATPAAAQNLYHTPHGPSAHAPTWARAVSDRASLASATQTVAMFDSVDVPAIPSSARAVAGYTTGLFPTFPTLVRDFPHAARVSIAINARQRAYCLDVEPGDAVPSQVVGWISFDRTLFPKPCVYSSFFEYTHEIRPLLAAAHIARSSIFEWDADYTFVPHIDSSFDATQWTDKALGRNLDESMVTLPFLGLSTATRLVCFGSHGTPKVAKCKPIVADVAKWTRARESTLRAIGSACEAVVIRNGQVVAELRQGDVCSTLEQRAVWFDNKAKSTIKRYS